MAIHITVEAPAGVQFKEGDCFRVVGQGVNADQVGLHCLKLEPIASPETISRLLSAAGPVYVSARSASNPDESQIDFGVASRR